MSSQAAIISKYLTLSPADSVESAIKALKKAKLEIVPVVDEDDILTGVFSLPILMKSLLPVSVAMSGGLPDITVPAAPGIAQRLSKVHMLRVSDVMERRAHAIALQTPLWEAVNYIVQYGSPLFAVEPGTGRYLGTITAESVLDELNRTMES